jgi:hypothetical protein
MAEDLTFNHADAITSDLAYVLLLQGEVGMSLQARLKLG